MYLIYTCMCKEDLALVNLQWLICFKTQPNQNIYWVFFPDISCHSLPLISHPHPQTRSLQSYGLCLPFWKGLLRTPRLYLDLLPYSNCTRRIEVISSWLHYTTGSVLSITVTSVRNEIGTPSGNPGRCCSRFTSQR